MKTDIYDMIYRYRNLTSSKSKIHKNYEEITYGEVISRFNDINFEYNDYETCIDMANIITHINNNGTIDDAKTGIEDEKIDAIGSFINSCDPSILKKGSPLQIASTVLKLISNPKSDNLSKEQFEKMIKESIDKEEKENNQQQNSNSDNQNDEEEEGDDQGENGDSDSEEKNEEKKEEEDGDGDGEGKGGNDDSDKDDKCDGQGKSVKNGTYSGDNPLINRIKNDPKKQIEDVNKYTEVREISNTYGLPMNDILDYQPILKEYNDFLNKLAIIESRGKMKAKKFIPKETTDMMNEYSQVSKIRNKTQMLMPNFGYKLATKNLIVKRNSFPTKQSLCLLIDDSGSMYEPYKMQWVKAILWNRAVESQKKNIDLYAALFEGRVYNITKINSLEEAQKFYKKIGFNGGGTNVQGCTEYMMNHFKQQNIEAQVVVINDGQDYVDTDWNPSQELHAIMLGHGNNNLQKVVDKKNGHYEVFKARD